MDLSFFGAAREVTGSCYCIEVNGKKILIDCGMRQGKDEEDGQEIPFDARDIYSVVLTHAHIDHSGRLPLLVKRGFKGKIYSIEATCDLLSIMLNDSAKIQEMDARWENRKNKRSGKKEVKPLYSITDVENTLNFLLPCSYNQKYEISKGVDLRFIDAGHILGSASVELFLDEGDSCKKIVFSGDIGNVDQPIIKDPQYIKETDYVVMEATYGDRDHKYHGDYTEDLANIIEDTVSKGGNVIIPSFAVGRTQGLLYLIREIKEKRMFEKGIDFPVYVDSPLASEATRLYDDDLHIYGDSETKIIVKKGQNPLSFPGLGFTDSTEESKALNYDPTPKVIISSSGMCEGGRIKHHLKHNLWREECSLVFVGYQAEGTLGRELLDGTKKVELFREEIAVLSKIYNFTGLSAHADRSGLLKWITNFEEKPDKVFVVHSEDAVCDAFIGSLEELGFKATAPYYRSKYDLSDGRLVSEDIIKEEGIYHIQIPEDASRSYSRLVHAYNDLSKTILDSRDKKSQDIQKLAEEIERIKKQLEKIT